jgi:hypothetical protein
MAAEEEGTGNVESLEMDMPKADEAHADASQRGEPRPGIGSWLCISWLPITASSLMVLR